VLPELGYEIQHGQLLRTWHCSKGLEKVIGHRDFRGQCHARVSIRILRNESGNTSPSARKQCHPLLLNTARVSVYWGRKTATFTSGQASSASASTHCLASSSSKPGTGTLTPMDANARHQGTSSEATISKASNQPDVTSTCCSEGLSSNANSPGISALPAHRRRTGSSGWSARPSGCQRTLSSSELMLSSSHSNTSQGSSSPEHFPLIT